MRPSDTSPEAWKIQLDILRRKGPVARFFIACQMSDDLHAWERGKFAAAEPPPRPTNHPATSCGGMSWSVNSDHETRLGESDPKSLK